MKKAQQDQHDNLHIFVEADTARWLVQENRVQGNSGHHGKQGCLKTSLGLEDARSDVSTIAFGPRFAFACIRIAHGWGSANRNFTGGKRRTPLIARVLRGTERWFYDYRSAAGTIPTRSKACCWKAVGVAGTVAHKPLSKRTVFRVTVARSASRVRKLWTG